MAPFWPGHQISINLPSLRVDPPFFPLTPRFQSSLFPLMEEAWIGEERFKLIRGQGDTRSTLGVNLPPREGDIDPVCRVTRRVEAEIFLFRSCLSYIGCFNVGFSWLNWKGAVKIVFFRLIPSDSFYTLWTVLNLSSLIKKYHNLNRQCAVKSCRVILKELDKFWIREYFYSKESNT